MAEKLGYKVQFGQFIIFLWPYFQSFFGFCDVRTMDGDVVDIESLIPHRGRMRLISEVAAVGAKTAETVSVAASDWPLAEDGIVNPLTLLELVAQTAGVCLGWHQTGGRSACRDGQGWLVGIKSARFFCDGVPAGSRIITRTENRVEIDHYTEVCGTVHLSGELIAEATLQVVRAEPGPQSPQPD